MSGWLTALGPAGTALALLLLGHALADFTLQTDGLAARKHRAGPLLAHVAIVLAVQTAAFAPLLSRRTATILGVVVGSHLLVDAVSARVRHRAGPSAPLFLGDQLAHLGAIVAAWALLAPASWTATPLVAALGGAERVPWVAVTTAAVYVAAFAFAREGGNAIVRGVLPADGPDPTDPEDLEAGSLVGTLERWLVLLLGLAGRWEAVALVVAAKSIARFEELKRRPFAEYFLVGTLASVLVAVVLVVAVTALV